MITSLTEIHRHRVVWWLRTRAGAGLLGFKFCLLLRQATNLGTVASNCAPFPPRRWRWGECRCYKMLWGWSGTMHGGAWMTALGTWVGRALQSSMLSCRAMEAQRRRWPNGTISPKGAWDDFSQKVMKDESFSRRERADGHSTAGVNNQLPWGCRGEWTGMVRIWR